MAKIGVVLSGCGFLDGSEIHESVLTLLAVSRAGAETVCAAPDGLQAETVNHALGQPTGETRSMLAEAARIARGKIKNLKDLKESEIDALIFPGGYGAAKNLCDFASKGVDCGVHPEAARIAREIHAVGKPIGAICIAPALIAKIFEGKNFLLTIGNDRGTVQALEKLGHRHQECGVREIAADEKNKIVTTPAYMYEASPAEVAEGVEKLVRQVIEFTRKK